MSQCNEFLTTRHVCDVLSGEPHMITRFIVRCHTSVSIHEVLIVTSHLLQTLLCALIPADYNETIFELQVTQSGLGSMGTRTGGILGCTGREFTW